MQTSLLSNQERQNQILEWISRRQRITVGDIRERFSVSEATARRDLETLAAHNKVQRVHGGAIPLQVAPPELPILQRAIDQVNEKQRIGRATASHIQDGETIFLGSGSTVLEVARSLRGRQITVVTNSLAVINALADAPNIPLIGLGGMFRASELSFIGHITEQALSEVRVDRVIIGTRAISPEQGLTNDYLPETMTDRAILRAGREVVIVADHTKFGRSAAAFLAPVTQVKVVVTDDQVPSDLVNKLERLGIEVILC